VTQIGNELRLARVRAGMTLREAEEETGVSKDTISRIERGLRAPQPLTVGRLAKAYGSPVKELLEESSAPLAEDPPQKQSREERVEERVQELIESPSFWAAKEKIEAGQQAEVSETLVSYMKRRSKIYEDELKDPNSPHFRSATAAALWAEALHQEAGMLLKLAIEEAKPFFGSLESPEEKGWAVVNFLKDLSRQNSVFEEIRQEADKRIAAMSDQPDVLSQKRYENARMQAEQSKQHFGELREAAGF
jgi:transcriptional regulator with XRE-family HTH domain